MTRHIPCVACDKRVLARLTNGREVYPHRPDLASTPYWRCDGCGNHIGCHHKTRNPTQPLGIIPTPELARARQAIHEVLDPLWKKGRIERKDLYAELSARLRWKYHTAKVRTVAEATDIIREIQAIAKELP